MFRRRTDQVYATLQQVQRRITEQAGGPAAGELTDRAPAPPAITPLQEALSRQARPQLVGVQPEIPPPPPMQLPSMQHHDGFLSISKQMAVTLVVLWVTCCAFFFWIGQHSGDRREAASAGYASGDAGNREAGASATDTGANRPLGDYLLVLESVPSWSQDAEQHYVAEAAELNGIMIKNTARGWKPWFGIRKPDNGGLELVFGEIASGVYGVNKSDFLDFAQLLKKYRGYDDVWVSLR